tara:strand:+ start:868 stop:1569 length:702 start_codon:yes stop_codon:yes gene_type:complete
MAKEFRYFGYAFTEEDIRRAMSHTRSNAEAARFLQVSIVTYQKYAKQYIDTLTGKSLWHIHLNISSKGIPKKWNTGELKGDLDKMLNEKQLNNPKRLGMLKGLLMKDGRLGYCCSACGYSERRLTDMKLPLMLAFKNSIRTDWRIENLKWLCYNCAFILGLDYFSNRMIRDIESHTTATEEHQQEIKSFYQFDDFYLEHLSKLGLDDQGDITNKSKNETDHLKDDADDLIDRV